MTDSTVPLHERPDIHERRWFLLGVMCLSLVLVVMSVSGLNVAIPSLAFDLDASATDLQWIVDSYAIIFAGLLLTAGAIGDRYGRKLALLGGLAVFGFGSLIGVIASTPAQVIVARSVMGVGAAFVMPATLSLVTVVFPPAERTKAIAIWAGFAGAGGALGPLIVGFLLSDWWISPAFWWGSAFAVNIVVVALVFAAVALYTPRSRDDSATPLDPVGALLSIVALGALLYGIIEGPNRGWTDQLVLGSFLVAGIMVVLFLSWEARARHPMLPLRFFEDRRFATGSLVITVAFFMMFGFFFLATQYLQFVRDYSPLDAGVATLPLAFTLVIVSPRSAALVDRVGLNRVISFGFGSVTAGFVVMALLEPGSPYLQFAAGLVLLGAGMGVTAAPSTGAIMSSVPLNKAGVGSAVNDTTREVGGALGIAVLGTIATSAYRGAIESSALGDGEVQMANGSIGEALRAASAVAADDPSRGAAIASEAGQAFTDAFTVTAGVSAVLAFAAAVTLFLISRRPPTGEVVARAESRGAKG